MSVSESFVVEASEELMVLGSPDESLYVSTSSELWNVVTEDQQYNLEPSADAFTLEIGDQSEELFTQQASELLVVNVGPQGSSGIGIGPAYTHTQASAAAAWVVAHNLGRKPMIDVQSSDQQVTARVTHPSNTGSLVEFNVAVTGQALCF